MVEITAYNFPIIFNIALQVKVSGLRQFNSLPVNVLIPITVVRTYPYYISTVFYFNVQLPVVWFHLNTSSSTYLRTYVSSISNYYWKNIKCNHWRQRSKLCVIGKYVSPLLSANSVASNATKQYFFIHLKAKSNKRNGPSSDRKSEGFKSSSIPPGSYL